MRTTCADCGEKFDAQGARGFTPRYCSNACKQRAYRRRKAQPRLTIPAKMRSARRWARADNKRPIRTTGLPASSTNPETWADYDEVQRGAGNGYGFMLGEGFGCYDLDYVVEDGSLKPWANEIIDSISENIIYTELSVSGTGLHVFVDGVAERAGRQRSVGDGRVEFYTRARFIRMGRAMTL